MVYLAYTCHGQNKRLGAWSVTMTTLGRLVHWCES